MDLEAGVWLRAGSGRAVSEAFPPARSIRLRGEGGGKGRGRCCLGRGICYGRQRACRRARGGLWEVVVVERAE